VISYRPILIAAANSGSKSRCRLSLGAGVRSRDGVLQRQTALPPEGRSGNRNFVAHIAVIGFAVARMVHGYRPGGPFGAPPRLAGRGDPGCGAGSVRARGAAWLAVGCLRGWLLFIPMIASLMKYWREEPNRWSFSRALNARGRAIGG